MLHRTLISCVAFATLLVGCSSQQFSNSFFSSSAIPAGVHLVEHQDSEPGTVNIPYFKYTLDNGLTVILSPDHSDPLVNVDVSYHVGSAREKPGRTGFAHFFEHMMFQGSKHVGDQQMFKTITEAGGVLNGTTDRDRTHYFETVPSNQLEKVLWLESDRMGFLLDAMSQKKFEIQRQTVKNERAQNYDNRPYGVIWEKMDEAMYPPTHPYSWQTIGYVQDLDHVNVNDLKAFFLKWYGPNNAVLTIGGDIDVAQTLNWVKKYFGSIPAGPKVVPMAKPMVSLPENRFITVEDQIKHPMVVIGWPTEYLGADSQIALDLLADVLGGGANSILYQSLVKTQEALSAGAFQKCGELSCTFYLYAVTASQKPGKLNALYHSLLSTLNALDVKGVDPERLAEIKGMAQSHAVFSLESVSSKVGQLANNQLFYDQPNRSETVLSDLNKVTPQAVRAVLQQFLLDEHQVVMSVVPTSKFELAAAPANFVSPKHISGIKHQTKSTDLQHRRIHDDFDRSVMPAVSHPVKPTVPELYSDVWNNGIELMGTKTIELPTTLINISIPAGERYVPKGKEGLAELTANLLQEGTTSLSAEAIESQLDQLGSSVSVSASDYSTTIQVAALTKNITPTMRLVEDMLYHPKFAKTDYERIKQQMVQRVIFHRQKLTWLASQATRQVLFGDTVFARDQDGSPQSLSNITLKDVQDFYAKQYTPKGTKVSIVGSISQRDAENQLSFLQQWQGDDAPLLAPQMLPKLGAQTLFYVDKPGASQSIVRLVRRGMPFDATGEMFLTQLANFNLAGTFNSRLNLDLREDKGYTYGMSGYLVSNREVGAIVFNAPVKVGATGATVKDIIEQMTHFSQQGLTDQEMDFMRLAVGQQDALAYETSSQKAGLIHGIMAYSLDNDYLDQRNKIIATVDKLTLDQLAKKWFAPQDYQIIVVGDMKKVKPQLASLGIPLKGLELTK